MISREDKQDCYEALVRSELWEDIKSVESWMDKEDCEKSSKYYNIIIVKLGKRTERSGGEKNQISTDATLPLLSLGMVIVDCSLEYLLIKKVKPVLRWDLVEDI